MWRHIGVGRVAARAHHGRRGQLLGTQIPHALGAAGAVRALVIGVVGAPFRARPVPPAGGKDDPSANLGPAKRAVDLAAVAVATNREHGATSAAKYESMVVQEPTPNAALLASSRVIGDGPSVCVPTRQGRSRAPTLGLLPFCGGCAAIVTRSVAAGDFSPNSGPDLYGTERPVTND